MLLFRLLFLFALFSTTTAQTIGAESCVAGTNPAYSDVCTILDEFSSVGEGSCIGDLACGFSFRWAGGSSCNDCEPGTLTIGDGSCIGDDVCQQDDVDLGTCDGTVGNGSCLGDEACTNSCRPNEDPKAGFSVGGGSCHGSHACSKLTAGVNIGDNSCLGDDACGSPFTPMEVGSNSCFGDRACWNNGRDYSAETNDGERKFCADCLTVIGPGSCTARDSCTRTGRNVAIGSNSW